MANYSENKISHIHCMGAHPILGALIQRGLNPIKLANSPRTASTFNRLDEHMSAFLLTAPTVMQNSLLLP